MTEDVPANVIISVSVADRVEVECEDVDLVDIVDVVDINTSVS